MDEVTPAVVAAVDGGAGGGNWEAVLALWGLGLELELGFEDGSRICSQFYSFCHTTKHNASLFFPFRASNNSELKRKKINN